MYLTEISHSKSDCFRQCRLRYKYRYVDRFVGDDSRNKDSLSFGTYIHEVFEKGVKASDFKELKRISEECKKSHKVPRLYESKVDQCLTNFIKFNENLTDTLGVELAFELEIAKDIKFNGVIDRIVKGKDGGILVIDYKTSKREKSKISLYQDPQLMGYHYAASKLFDVDSDNIICGHFYPLTNHFVHVKFPKHAIYRHIKSMIDDAWRIKKAKKDELIPSKNEYCDWCQFKTMCPLFTDQCSIKVRIDEELRLKEEKKKLND